MAYSEDHVTLAAEYALGTLDADERALVETMMIVDPGFLEMVEAWNRKLAPAHQIVAPAEPPAELWERIKAVTVQSKQRAVAATPPESKTASGLSEPAVEASRPEVVPEPVVEMLPLPTDDVVVDQKVSAAEQVVPKTRSGHLFGTFMTAVAACLAAVVCLQIYRPDLLPEQLRVKPEVRIVEVKTPAPPAPAQFVAVIQSNAKVPDFILTVDKASLTFTARRVGAPPAQDRSYELWFVSRQIGQPRSLGVIKDEGFTTSKALAAYDRDLVESAIYAITVEQKGGSPTGAPTAQPLWAGRLAEAVPAQTAGP